MKYLPKLVNRQRKFPKILYVYREYHDRRRAYGDVLRSIGYDVMFLRVAKKKQPDQVAASTIKAARPDLIWLSQPSYVAYNGISSEALDYIKSAKIPLISYCTFATDVPYTEWMHVWRMFDFIFPHNIEMHQFLVQNGINSTYMPVGFYPNQYYKYIVPKSIPISFMGNYHSHSSSNKRCLYLDALNKFGVVVYGESFSGKIKAKVYPYSTHKEQVIVYGKSIINLDLPFINSSLRFYNGKPHIKNRFFEIPATGNLLLTVRCPEFQEIFSDDEVGYYDDNVESLTEIVARYVKDTKIASKMALRAYGKVHNLHTFKHRFESMAKVIEA
jgi:hypothetical protein